MLKKVVDVKDAKEQILFSLPMILTNVFYNLIPMTSVMFAGHFSELQLAGSTLADSWATVTGYAFMLGLSGALETLCGQGFGSNLYNMLGIYLQASCMISFVFSIIISVIWWFTEPIVEILHQSPVVSKETAIYIRYLIPGIFAFGILQNIIRFLQAQSVVFPLVFSSLVPLLLHCGLNYLLVHYTTLGFKGAALATSITFWLSVIILIIHVSFANKFEHTWKGLSNESFFHVFYNLKLALPSAAMVCFEYWAFEILVLLAGLMPDSETTSLMAICSFAECDYYVELLISLLPIKSAITETIAYMGAYGLSAAASTRVSNLLGAGKPSQAKSAIGVTIKLSILLAMLIALALGLGRYIWASFFSDNASIIKAFASMTHWICISIFLDSIQGVLSGVCRGCGWQHFAVFINLGTFYFVGMPIAYLTAFKFHLHVKGLWIGLICGLTIQSASLFLITRFHKWTALEISSRGNENSLRAESV